MADAGGKTLADIQIGGNAPCPLLSNIDRSHGTMLDVLDTMQTDIDGIGMGDAAGAASASGLLIGRGTSADPATTAVADAKFVELRCSTSAATGDNRLMYLRYAIEGAAGGECLRALTMINENTSTAHGAHLSLGFEAAAGGSECSGLGVAARATLHIPDIASWAPTGTYAVGMFEIYSDGSDSDPAGMGELSILQLANSGDATGAADIDTDAFLLSIQGFTSGSGKTVYDAADTSPTVGGSLKIKIGSDTRYLYFYDSEVSGS